MEVVVHCPYLEALVVGLHLLLAEMVHFAVLVVPDSTVVVEELDELWLIKVVEQQIFSACLVVFDFAVRGKVDTAVVVVDFVVAEMVALEEAYHLTMWKSI